MIELQGFALLRPWWLLAIPVIAALSFIMARRVTGLAAWERAIDLALMAHLKSAGAAVAGAAERQWLTAGLAGLIALGLAGPATRSGDLTAFRNLDGLVLAIDLSPSVVESGYLGEALTAARIVASGAGSRPVALVVFGQDAYEASGFTIDARALGTTIAVLDGETVPGIGTRPERALALARKQLEESHTLAGDVVLVSDGGGVSAEALTEAAALAAQGARLSALFVPHGSGAGAPPPDRAALASLVQAGSGVIADAADPQALLSVAAARTASRLASSDYAVLAWTDHGRWLLALALLAALPMFRRRA